MDQLQKYLYYLVKLRRCMNDFVRLAEIFNHIIVKRISKNESIQFQRVLECVVVFPPNFIR